jgi:DNA-directed RNA polymerase subunit K/omega
MEYKKSKIEQEAITRNLSEFDTNTQNLYETIVILSKRASQISTGLREELHEKLKDFTSHIDNLEEVFENREQIEIARHYEQLPKPSLVSVSEFLNEKIYYRVPDKE